MLGALLFILGGSAVYVGILTITNPENIRQEDDEGRIKDKKVKNKR